MSKFAEALAVLEEAAKTPRARAALSALQSEVEATDRESSPKSSSSEKPRFPDPNLVAEHFGLSDDDSARGGYSSKGSQGSATAREGS